MLLTSPSSFYTAESMFIPVDLDTCIVLNALAFVVVVVYGFHNLTISSEYISSTISI